MDEVFSPEKLAVVGASERPGNLASGIFKNLIRYQFKGEIFPVGRKTGSVFDMPLYAGVDSIPGTIDAAVILTPAKTVYEMTDKCIRKGARAVYVETGGFSEMGAEGERLAARLLGLVREHNVRLIGPNCIGVINAATGLATSFVGMYRAMPGAVSVVSQSGGYGVSIVAEFYNRNIGLGKFASVGNKLDVDETDCVEYFSRDPGTEVICLHLESITDGRRFCEAVSKCPKPVVIHKANRGTLSKKVAQSHTAALASDDSVVMAALEQAGAHMVGGIREMATAASALTLAPLKGKRLIAISRSGGHAVLAADACERYGFELPPVPESVLEEARKRMRASVINLTNPMDLGDLWDRLFHFDLLDMCLAHDGFDAAVFQYGHMIQESPPFPADIMDRIRKISLKHNKPVGFCFVHNDEMVYELNRRTSYPIFYGVDDAVAALAVRRNIKTESIATGLTQKPDGIDRSRVEKVVSESNGQSVSGSAGYEFLDSYGIGSPELRMVSDEDEAVQAAGEIGFPLALKVISQKLSHKTDAGGVVLNLNDSDEVRKALKTMRSDIGARFPNADVKGFLLQKMMPPGMEMIVGARRTDDFGPVVLAGFGGIYVEVMADSAMRLAPCSEDEAREMLMELKGYSLLKGTRGRTPADVDALVDIIVRLSVLISDHERISEIDLNPVIVFPRGHGVTAVDVRVVLG